jgi:hypothetical protein
LHWRGKGRGVKNGNTQPLTTAAIAWPMMVLAQDYIAVFQPLVLGECAAQMLRGVEEGEVVLPHPGVPAKCEQVC